MARNSLINIMNLIDEAKQEQTPDQSFLNDLKRSIEMTAAKNRKPGSKTYKPSGMNCMRQSYYVIKGIDSDPYESSYTLEGICNAGSDIHVRIQNAVIGMAENEMDCEWINIEEFIKSRELTDLEVVSNTSTETKLFNKKYNISFMCDGMVRYKNRYYILEFKTESSFKFQNRKSVDPKHYHQATAYSLSFGIDEVIFIYINRDVLEMKSFLFNVTGDMKQDLIGYIVDCDSYLEKGEAPPKPIEASPKFCQYCNYKLQCRKDG